MNGNRKTRFLRWLGILATLLGTICNGAIGAGFPDVLEDPLLARPPVLDRGAALPDGTTLATCSASVPLKAALSLVQAVNLALCNNPQIKGAWAAIKVQAAAVGQARAAYLPTASVSISRMHTGTQYPGFPESDTYANGHTVNAGVALRLFDFGTQGANRDAANRALEAALASHDATMLKTVSAVVNAYFDAQSAQAALAARQQSTTLAERTYAATQRRERGGMGAQSEVLQAATALAKAKLTQERAQAEVRSTMADLVYVLGLQPSARLELPQAEASPAKYLVDDLQQWLDEAGAHHPAIRAAKAQYAAMQAKVAAARAEGLPTIDLTGNFYQNGYPNQGLQPVRSNQVTAGVTLTIPLFEGFVRTYKIRDAQAQAEQTEAQLQDSKHQVLTDVIKTHAVAVAAAESLAASEALLLSAQEAFASSQRRYDKGGADVLELLSAQSALADAEQERVRSLTEWASARLRLATAAGVLNWLTKQDDGVAGQP